MDKIKSISKELKQNPFFRMSQSSMELVHSNIWAWLYEIMIDKQAFFKFFGSNVKYNGQQCFRELHHIDLCLLMQKKKTGKNGNINNYEDLSQPGLIIENKVKDIAKADQLLRYNAKFSDKQDKVLATLFACPVPSGFRTETYTDIISRIKKEVGNMPAEHSYFVQSYIYMSETLVQLANELIKFKSDVYDFLSYDENFGGILREISPINMQQSYLKYCYGTMAQEIKSVMEQSDVLRKIDIKLGTDGINKKKYEFNSKPWIQINWGISSHSKEGLVDVALIKDENTRIGIQIQNGMYRKFISSLDNKAEIKLKDMQKKKYFFTEETVNVLSYGDGFKYVNVKSPGEVEMEKEKILSGQKINLITQQITKDIATIL